MSEREDSNWMRDLDAGLDAAFGSDAVPMTGSVLARIERWGGLTPRILLREAARRDAPEAAPVGASASERYEVHGEIARGGMGIVLKGRDVDLGRDVAMKVIRPEYANSAETLQRFIEEAQIGGQLQHPGIVPVYEIGLQEDRRVFFTMKLIRGETFEALLKARSDPEEDRHRFLDILEQVCLTVAYAHEQGVVHRDLKPANVMVGSFGEVQVVDWGFAKLLARDEAPQGEGAHPIQTVRLASGGSGSEAGSVLGTPRYMPPEQARGAIELVDERSDVFALGGMLTEILTGRPTYTRQGRELVLQAVQADLEETFERLDACGAEPELVSLAKRCLSKERASRPANAKAVASEITAYLGSAQERARKAELEAARAEVKAREERKARRLTLALAAAVLLALLLGGGGYLWVEAGERRRAEQAEQEVRAALEEARELQGQARGDRSLWEAAVKACERAVQLAHRDGVQHGVLQRALALLAEVEVGAARAASNAALLATLSEVRARAADSLDLKAIDEAYATAFAPLGVRVDAVDLDAVTALVLESGIEEELAAFLDDWMWLRGTVSLPNEPLLQLARAVDPDEVRSRLREAAAGRDPAALLAVADSLSEDDLARGNLPNLLALHLSSTGERERAVAILRNAQRLRPGDFWLNYRLGFELTLVVPPAWEEAISFFRVALAQRPESAEVRHQLGIALFKTERYDEAIAVWEDAIQLHPDYLHALDHIIEAHEKKGTLDELIARWESSPSDWVEYFRLGRALEVKGDWERVVAAYDEALRRAPSAFLYEKRGLALQYGGDPEAAIESHHRALELDPTCAEAYSGIARVRWQQQDVQAAFDANERALALNPYHPLYHDGRGGMLQEMGRFEEALEAFRETIRVRPDYIRGYQRFASVRRSMGDLPGAIAQLERSVTLPERFSEGRFEPRHEGQVDLRTGKRQLVPKLGRHRPKGGAYENLAIAFYEKGDLEAAARAYREDLRIWPGQWTVRASLAIVLRSAGDHQGALEHVRQALEMQPQEPFLPYLLCFALLGTRRYEEAAEEMAEYARHEVWANAPEGAREAWRDQRDDIIAMARDLPDVLSGKRVPSSPREQALAAWVCHELAWYAASARLYAEAFAADPTLAAELMPWPPRWHRIGDAAQAAVLAARGLGLDGAALTTEQRTAFRDRALAWMRRDMQIWNAEVESGDPALRKRAVRQFRNWLAMRPYATVRVKSNLAELPDEERLRWEAFWSDVRKGLAELTGR